MIAGWRAIVNVASKAVQDLEPYDLTYENLSKGLDSAEWFTNTSEYRSWASHGGDTLWHSIADGSEKQLYPVLASLIRGKLPGQPSRSKVVHTLCDQMTYDMAPSVSLVNDSHHQSHASKKSVSLHSISKLHSIISQLLFCSSTSEFRERTAEVRSLCGPELKNPWVSLDFLKSALDHVLELIPKEVVFILIHKYDICLLKGRTSVLKILIPGRSRFRDGICQWQ